MPKRRRTVKKRETDSGPKRRRDIVVVGASAGGVEALTQLIKALPPNFPAALFVVVHVPPYPPSILPDILSRSGPLPAMHAVHGEPIRTGRIYIAPPDNHLLLQSGYVRVVRGPRENGHRPAVDPLFRTAARAYGPRVIGVVLTGALDCGTAGLLAVKAQGGIAVVQEPREAFCSDMPRSAVEHVKVDYILPLSEIVPALVRLTGEVIKEGDGMRRRKKEEKDGSEKPVSYITCPECNGALVEWEVNRLIQYACHVGHLFSMEGMVAEQAEQLETALWSAVRALEESEALARRMSARSDSTLAVRFEEKAQAMKQHSELIRQILLKGDLMARPDASGGKEGKEGKGKRSKKRLPAATTDR